MPCVGFYASPLVRNQFDYVLHLHFVLPYWYTERLGSVWKHWRKFGISDRTSEAYTWKLPSLGSDAETLWVRIWRRELQNSWNTENTELGIFLTHISKNSKKSYFIRIHSLNVYPNNCLARVSGVFISIWSCMAFNWFPSEAFACEAVMDK